VHHPKERAIMKGFASFCYKDEHGDTLSILKFFSFVPTEAEAKYVCGLLLAKEFGKNWEGFEEDFLKPCYNEHRILQKLAECLNPLDPDVRGWITYGQFLDTYLQNAVFVFGPMGTASFVKWSE